MHLAIIQRPGKNFLRQYAESNHDELKIEPVIPEPQEQIGTENDRKPAET